MPYSRKLWQVESLANLANHLRFTKLKPSKLVLTINNPLPNLLIRQIFSWQMLEKSKFAKEKYANLHCTCVHVHATQHTHAVIVLSCTISYH